jgi:hypothetical protein
MAPGGFRESFFSAQAAFVPATRASEASSEKKAWPPEALAGKI